MAGKENGRGWESKGGVRGVGARPTMCAVCTFYVYLIHWLLVSRSKLQIRSIVFIMDRLKRCMEPLRYHCHQSSWTSKSSNSGWPASWYRQRREEHMARNIQWNICLFIVTSRPFFKPSVGWMSEYILLTTAVISGLFNQMNIIIW